MKASCFKLYYQDNSEECKADHVYRWLPLPTLEQVGNTLLTSHAPNT